LPGRFKGKGIGSRAGVLQPPSGPGTWSIAPLFLFSNNFQIILVSKLISL